MKPTSDAGNMGRPEAVYIEIVANIKYIFNSNVKFVFFLGIEHELCIGTLGKCVRYPSLVPYLIETLIYLF